MSKYKKNKAVALRYNVDEDTSPVVIASGYGTVAEHIIDIAEKKGIPVFKDDSAASLLCMLDVGSNIDVYKRQLDTDTPSHAHTGLFIYTEHIIVFIDSCDVHVYQRDAGIFRVSFPAADHNPVQAGT